MFFNALRAKSSPPIARPIEEQEERESQKLWAATAQAVKERNHELATIEKTKIEDQQREDAAKRVNDGVEWHPRLFRMVRGGPGGSEEGEEDLEWIINATMSVNYNTKSLVTMTNKSQRRGYAREAGRADHGNLSHCERPAVRRKESHSPSNSHDESQ